MELALTETETRELLATVRSLNARLDQSFADFKMEEIPKRHKANLPSVLDWWDGRVDRGEKSRYLLPLLVTAICPIIGGVIVAVILKALHL
jgi:hypothetical protein